MREELVDVEELVLEQHHPLLVHSTESLDFEARQGQEQLGRPVQMQEHYILLGCYYEPLRVDDELLDLDVRGQLN